MSAMPARVTEVLQGTDVSTVSVRPPMARSSYRAERRAERMMERRSKQRWTVWSCVVLAAAFTMTVGILDVLH
jgi:hypothetical protein